MTVKEARARLNNMSDEDCLALADFLDWSEVTRMVGYAGNSIMSMQQEVTSCLIADVKQLKRNVLIYSVTNVVLALTLFIRMIAEVL